MWARAKTTIRLRPALAVAYATPLLVGLTLVVVVLMLRPSPAPTHAVNVSVSEDDSDSDVTNETAGRPWFMRGGTKWPAPGDVGIDKLFPEDAPGEDRIVEQLMYALPKDEEFPMKVILLANGLRAWGARAGRAEFARTRTARRRRCPVHQCALTGDRRQAATADAILFKHHYTNFNVKRPPGQIWILYYLECPWHTPPLHSWLTDQFNWTATYRRDSELVAPYARWVYYDKQVTQRELTRNYAAKKTKKVAWFVSNCEARNNRLQFAQRLARHITVDIYGACGLLRCARGDPACWKMLRQDYKFYLAFENSNCRDYITEKFFAHGLQHDILPIVMGARVAEYAAAAPRRSYVHVDEFAGAAELAAYLRQLDANDELYNSYFKWKGTGEFINTYFFCRLCALLHARDRRRRTSHYADARAWWSVNACTRGRWESFPSLNLSSVEDAPPSILDIIRSVWASITSLNSSAGDAPSIINVLKKFFSP